MGKVVLRDGSAPHSDCSSADQAILNSASFDAKHERRWWYPRFFGSFWWYLHVFARDPKSKIRRFPGGGRADQKIAGWTALSSPCCYLEDIGRLKTIVNYTNQVIPRLRMDICFEKVWSKMYIFFATPKNC